MNLSDLQTVAGAAAVVAVLVQVLKRYVHEDVVPGLALAVGIAVVALATLGLGKPFDAGIILVGLLAGASAIGLYEVQSGVVLKPKKED